MILRSRPLALIIGFALAASTVGVTATTNVAAAAAPQWSTTFRDDFGGTGLPNADDWQLTLGNSYPGGPDAFGTGEIETLTDNKENVDVRSGNLYITPQRDESGQWTSARVESIRANFKPADGGVMHVESRVQMPNVTGKAALGYWPAFWMLGSPYRADRWSWPSIGEFDIMENVQGLNWSYGVLHCGTWGGPCNEPEGLNNGGTPCQVTTCQAGFHVYAMEWDRSGATDELRWYVDGVVTHSVDESDVPAATWTSLASHAGYFVILNVAMGGAFPNKLGGGPTAATKPGVPMVVDYVEVRYLGGQGTPSVTASPTASASPTALPTVSASPTASPTVSASPTALPTVSASPTASPTVSASPTVTVSPTSPEPDGGPANLKVTGNTSNSITLGWDGTKGASYDVLRAGLRIATVTGLAFTDVGLQSGTPYLYSIQGNGTTTRELTAAPGVAATTTPTASTGTPSALKVTDSTADTISIGWKGPPAATYDVLRSGIRIATVSGLAFTDIGLQVGTRYLYSIRGNGFTTGTLAVLTD